ncbi:Late embryogenesis abundant protein D-34, putative isoform 2 [Theobroma cacao]|uniref:Late embryogenesis abundant protein D-34, putative isoform 2 n=1 Tax=Theobroma cacao TaxID=3641 RepID=A0A061DRM7_THECC|nr:Late embryogenesis abundant protein D-34, putative isoform 2 [Theobroma cacao]
MSQRQPRRPQGDQTSDQEAIKYGDVFDVTGGLASKPVAPRDTETMRIAENQVLGKTLDAGAAAVMQSAADVNVMSGVVCPSPGNKMVEREGVAVPKSRDLQGKVVVTEAIAGQIVGQYTPSDVRGITPFPSPTPVRGDVGWTTSPTPTGAVDHNGITIGEALEATAISVGDKPVDQGDAAAIRVAEVRAAGSNVTQRNGLGATAQAAATFNDRVSYDYNKMTISNVLSDASSKFPQDKAVTSEDADGVRGAELRNKLDMIPTPGGVADTMATAARGLIPKGALS